MSRVRTALRLTILPVIVVVSLVIAWQLGYFELAQRERVVALLRQGRETAWAGPLYATLYVLAATVGLPTTPLSVLGGALFGAPRGFALAWTAEMLATLTAYTLARSIGQRPVRRFLGRHHLLRRMEKRADFSTLLRLRVLPVAPFAVLDYVAGLAGVSLRVLLLATAVGILPSVIAYTYVGAELASGLGQTGAEQLRSLRIAGAVTFTMIFVSLSPSLIRWLRQ
ncbi:MAG TPA: VTT domain-containing protein [Gemmatimonadaceae bacterium]|nr:VTT domain-containing protein [Gemmatimonadaceae bacterium]